MNKLTILLSLLAIAGCKQLPDIPTAISPYRIEIQQGNVVTQEMISKLKPGMTRAQVRFALGSPLVVDPFRTDRWDYVYMLQKQGRATERRNITVIFEDEKLARIDGDVVALPQAIKPAEPPAAKPPVAAKPETKPAAKPVDKQPATAENKSDPAKADAAKDKPKEEKGFFGRMLDKVF